MTTPESTAELALRVIAEADPGPMSGQSLAYEMASIAKQAIAATQPGDRVAASHRLDPSHARDCECHPCWLVKELG